MVFALQFMFGASIFIQTHRPFTSIELSFSSSATGLRSKTIVLSTLKEILSFVKGENGSSIQVGIFFEKIGEKDMFTKKQNKTKKIKGGKEKPCWNILTLKLSFSGYQKITGEGGCHRGPKISRPLKPGRVTLIPSQMAEIVPLRGHAYGCCKRIVLRDMYCIFVQPQNGHFRY